MKIAFKKITTQPKEVSLILDGVQLSGELYRLNATMLCLKGKLSGEITLVCDYSGEEFEERLDNPLVLYISDGFWDTQSQSKKLDSFEVIEFFDGFVDLHYILESEIESLRSDYHVKEEFRDRFHGDQEIEGEI